MSYLIYFVFLKIGVIFDVLHHFRNLPVKKGMLMIMVRGIFNLSLNSFRIKFRIEFGPTAF